MRKIGYVVACAATALALATGCAAPAASDAQQAATSATEQSSSTDAAQPGSDAQDAATSDEAASAASATASASAGDPANIAKAFPSWKADSAALAELVSYVQDVTTVGGASYIPPEERVATFDMDGTLLCEKAPVYVDYCLLLHRVFDDPSYQAPEEDRKVCEQIRADADQGIVDGELDEQKNAALVRAFEGMTPEDFRAYVEDFIDTAQAEGFEGMTYGESVYRPMAEVVDYLRANDFTVYIVSACEREVARAIGVSKLGIEPNHVIGTDYGTKATGQGDEAVNKYTFAHDDELVFDGTKVLEVAKMNKVVYIEREIGRRPVLAFGNSSGDYAMLNYAVTNPDHQGKAFLVLCDDVEREYGDLERAEKQTGEAAEGGWTIFSMANDWATIYGEGVTRTELPADAALAQAA